jgi:AraC family transcriptional regulator of adaptative response/methylated-DNA-[protein]-cysteine methyltransferase
VAAHLAEPRAALDLPLDLRGTAFQRRVWEALTRIPAGETRTYSGLAAEIGAPTATRAVARACAQNPLAPAVPCHRGVGKGGDLTGYRWGVPNKRRLLEAEGALTPPAPR